MDLAERGAWIEKWDRPELVVTAEEIAAWRPLIEGERAARRVAETMMLLTAGRDSESPDHRNPTADKLRRSYVRLWHAWKLLDEKYEWRWALNEVELTINAHTIKAARVWRLEHFVEVTAPAIESNALVGIRKLLLVVGTRSTRAARREVNEIVVRIVKELEYLRWAL